ncbi:C-GCAxxG-C-C family (seleno)protein [Petroclostridium sp. X23]|jgi:C_GCAxxG_C_C family probable redox protein|uniref:C-GCAxxG-C-C family (seleno)protein n=1 Tax=Petroclostridium sp. X23 TaxID=3045146 RepID=UPI0024AC9B04|nr:C-GCAxxG-C-C family (seleno)protein [Petroclostridium sp. X23]WHH56978.1 C-GCAxxG-C-C family (seleno)protein [Petroclostridium sp. X23]
MLKEKAVKYYSKEYDLNCAETMIYAANEEYQMNLSKETFKTMAAFGGGMAIEDVCGAVTGAIAVLGILFTVDRAHESDRMKLLTSEFINKFDKALSTINCKKLKDMYKNDDVRCIKMIEAAADILDEIVVREIK